MKLKEALKDVLKGDELTRLTKSCDIIGDIIVIKIQPEFESKKAIIATALYKIYPRVRTIAALPLFAYTNELYRTRDLEVIWGDDNLETRHRESGCVFAVDIKRVFFSPRLSYERMRIADKVSPGETIINLFSGVGCFSIRIAKMQPKTIIYSIDLNPYAVLYMTENVALNKVEGEVIPILGDARAELKRLEGVADRVLMPLPEEAHSFLPLAVRALNLDNGDGMIHYYDVSTGKRGNELFGPAFERAKEILYSAFGTTVEIGLEEQRIVRSVGPCRYHVVLDLRVHKTI
ncbi:tRNA (guanine37-N1)-methyltransferase [Methanophagales archaeon]|nr:tRNA (guanine37-N1)-methyltransferase [Methanophagales archaeon]